MASMQSLPFELLENILQHLTWKDLLLAQGVCTQWHQVVQRSPPLRRLIFLGIVPAGKLSAAELERFVHDNTCTPLPSRRPSTPSLDDKELRNEDKSVVTALAKPLSGPIVQYNPVFPSEGDTIRMSTMQFRAKLESPSSWLDMHLTQPPCTQAGATIYYKRSAGNRFRIFGRKGSDTATRIVKVINPEGVQARDVLLAARESKAGSIKKCQRIDICVPGVVRA